MIRNSKTEERSNPTDCKKSRHGRELIQQMTKIVMIKKEIIHLVAKKVRLKKELIKLFNKIARHKKAQIQLITKNNGTHEQTNPTGGQN